MRVLFVNTARDLGGGITSAVELSRGLASRGHQVTVACHPAGGIHAALQGDPGIATAVLPVRAELNPWRIVQLAKIAQETQPAVVLADRRKDVKLGVAVSRLIGRASRLPVVHRHGAPSVLRDSPTYRAIWSRLHLLIVNSEWMRQALLRTTPWIARVPLQVIPNGKDTEVFRPRPEMRVDMRSQLGLPAHAFVICYHGVLQQRKRIDVLIEAVDALRSKPDVHAVIVGDGPDAQSLRDSARGLPIVFTGRRDDVPNVLSCADVAVHMSEAEGFSNAVLEAMSCGLPVIASRSTSHPEQVVEGETGFLIEPGDSGALADRIARLYTDRSIARSLGAASRQRVVDRFTLDRMLDAYESALDRVTH